MSNAKAIDFETIIRQLLPPGSLWRPKEYELGTTSGDNLVKNSTFLTDLSFWTTGGSGGGANWTPNTTMVIFIDSPI